MSLLWICGGLAVSHESGLWVGYCHFPFESAQARKNKKGNSAADKKEQHTGVTPGGKAKPKPKPKSPLEIKLGEARKVAVRCNSVTSMAAQMTGLIDGGGNWAWAQKHEKKFAFDKAVAALNKILSSKAFYAEFCMSENKDIVKSYDENVLLKELPKVAIDIEPYIVALEKRIKTLRGLHQTMLDDMSGDD